MKTAPIPPAPENVNWTPMPDPIRKEEVNIQLAWTADARTQLAIRRQANLNGFETSADYLTQIIAWRDRQCYAKADRMVRDTRNRGHWPDLQVRDRVIVRLFFASESR